MTDGMEAITNAALSTALDVATLRHKTIINNIANVNTEGFIPQRLNFEGYIQNVRFQIKNEGKLDAQNIFELSNSRPLLEPVLTANGLPTKVQLDAEVAAMTENAVHYQALVRALSRQMSILLVAASDGKR